MEEINSKAEKTEMEKERNTQRPRSHAAHGTACRGFLAVQNQNFKLALFKLCKSAKVELAAMQKWASG